MIKNIQFTIDPFIFNDKEKLRNFIFTQAIIENDTNWDFVIIKKSIDARRKNILINLIIDIYINEPILTKKNTIKYNKVDKEKTIHIIGAGPAGLFAALACIENGIKPIVFERGKNVQERRRDLAAINKNHIVNTESNYCFGEGGAGTYSDGKLYTRSGKRGSIEKILHILVQHGATNEILIDAHPHIGTNKLPKIITDIRETILNCGGEIHFNSKLVNFETKNNKIKNITIEHIAKKTNETFLVNHLILATGHSARDIFELLNSKNIKLEAKDFALGVRVEHPQSIIDKQQYHCNNKDQLDKIREVLPAASYNWVEQVKGKGVYSFCMCPGGIIAPCATGREEIVTNGWSPSKRNNPYANSGVVTTVDFDIYKSFKEHGALAALKYQQMVEKACYIAAGKTQAAPAQRLIDFCENKISKDLPNCSYQPGLVSCNLNDVLPKEITEKLKQALKQLSKKMPFYYTNEAVLVAPETRTSSPVRIPRIKDSYNHVEISNLYPCAEGSGYAGGIVSAAIDGENCVIAIVKSIIY